MICITVDMWPKGDEKKKYRLGRAFIWNKLQTSGDKNNYGVAVQNKYAANKPIIEGMPITEQGILRQGEVNNYPSARFNMWRLIIRGLLSAFPEEYNEKRRTNKNSK
jgi:hypothetical protein